MSLSRSAAVDEQLAVHRQRSGGAAETEIPSYLVGQIDAAVDTSMLGGFGDLAFLIYFVARLSGSQ